MSRHYTEKNLRHTEASLPDCHTEHEPPPYSTRASAIQNDFFKHCFICIIKDLKKFQRGGQNIVTKDFYYLFIVMNSAFDYSLSGL